MAENKKTGARKVISIVVDVLIWLLLIVAVLLTTMVFTSKSNGGVPNLLGKMPISVQSGSMEKEFFKGDMIISSKVKDMSSLKAGDVISFWTLIEEQKVINTHRIVEVTTQNGLQTFTTKGDNNPINDTSKVSTADIIGKYDGFKIPKLGTAIDFLQSSNGFLFCIVLPLLLFFLYELYRFVIVLMAYKKPKLSSDEEDEIKKKAVAEYLASQAENKEDNKDDEK
ncbi:MAG: signal peptidase I [Clostridia bacterium]